MTNMLHEIWLMAAEAAPWLAFGLIAAALVKALVPTGWISNQLGRSGFGSVLKGSLVGIPLPLCSCGVLPTALGLRRQGAGKPATVSFLVSTPEIGLDSFLLSFALLGPFMAIARPIAAFCSAVFAGVMALFADRAETAKPPLGRELGAERQVAEETHSCCCGEKKATPEPAKKSCCSSNDERAGSSSTPAPEVKPGVFARFGDGLKYVFTTLWDDVKLWLGVAVVVAGIAMWWTGGQPAEFLQQWGSGPLAMFVMLLIGIPLYICATASTPIAAALLVAGVSPGTVLVLLLAGPATNIGSIAILQKELGTRVLIVYLLSIAVTTMAAGLIVDAIVGGWHFNIAAQAHDASHLLPHWFGTVAAIALIVMAIKPLRNALFGWGAKKPATAAATTAQTKSSCCCGSGAAGQSAEPQAEQASCH